MEKTVEMEKYHPYTIGCFFDELTAKFSFSFVFVQLATAPFSEHKRKQWEKAVGFRQSEKSC